MAWKPFKPCAYSGCPDLTKDRYCPIHEKLVNQQYEKKREKTTARGYGTRWQKEKEKWLDEHPKCVDCHETDRRKLQVDHGVPHKGDKKLFWDKSKWKTRCIRCHSAKTAREDGGFGNLKKEERKR